MASDALLRRFALSVFQGITALLLFSFFTLNSDSATADIEVLVNSETDLPYTHKFNNASFKPGYELQLKGQNNSDSVLILIVRIDNASSRDYRTRYNREFSIQPGEFSLTLPMTGLKTAGKQPLLLPSHK